MVGISAGAGGVSGDLLGFREGFFGEQFCTDSKKPSG